MAIAKCEQQSPPMGIVRQYVRQVEPVGYPNTAVVCNASGCNNPALIWLDREEERDYNNSERIFNMITGAIKIAVR